MTPAVRNSDAPEANHIRYPCRIAGRPFVL